MLIKAEKEKSQGDTMRRVEENKLEMLGESLYHLMKFIYFLLHSAEAIKLFLMDFLC